MKIMLISKRIPFMKLVSLPREKQIAIHGPSVNVPTIAATSKNPFCIRSNPNEVKTKIELQRSLHVPACKTREDGDST